MNPPHLIDITPAEARRLPRCERTGFAIGWDAACHGIPFFETWVEYKPVADGYKAGRAHFGAKATCDDRFIRKWIQLRIGAWVRNRVFDDKVTPDYLRRIDVPFCPIMRVRLTHQTRLPSDWSVDRVNNGAAYARGNLIVCSTEANHLKRDLDADGAVTQDHQGRALMGEGPWLRLQTLIAMTVDRTTLFPLRVTPPNELFIANQWVFVQNTLTLLSVAGGARWEAARRRFREHFGGKKAKKATDRFQDYMLSSFHRLMRQGGALPRDPIERRHRCRCATEDAWADPTITRYFQAWVNEVGEAKALRIEAAAALPNTTSWSETQEDYAAWHTETRGFVLPESFSEVRQCA